MSGFNIDEKELYQLYIEENMSSSEIAEKFGVGIYAVKHRLKKFGIKKDKEKIVEKIKGSSLEKRKKTCLKKYGVEHPMKNDKVLNKAKETFLKKYGCEYGSQNQEIQNKRKKTCLEKYGYETPLKNPEIIKKTKATIIKKYGVDNVMKSKVVQEKVQETCLQRYGVKNVFESKEFQEKADLQMQKRYGAKNSSQVKSIKRKQEETCLQKYGIRFYCISEDCQGKNGFTISKANKEFSKLLLENDIRHQLEKNIKRYSYDIFIEDDNIVLEINPTYTHNSTNGTWFHNSKKKPLEKDYHYNKTIVAKQSGYRCIHIFDWDDKEKIINLLKSKEILEARKCKIKEVSTEDTALFLSKNHLQGNCRGQDIRLGLYYNDKLVEIITFGKPRYNKKYDYELIRLCSHNKYRIIGGTEKLFKFFLKKYKPKSIISYCDNSKFNGEVYERLKFKLKDYGKPSKHWYNAKTKKHITDNLLRQRGYDQLFNTSYGKGTSNEQLMIQNGFVEIYDCGQSTYIWEEQE